MSVKLPCNGEFISLPVAINSQIDRIWSTTFFMTLMYRPNSNWLQLKVWLPPAGIPDQPLKDTHVGWLVMLVAVVLTYMLLFDTSPSTQKFKRIVNYAQRKEHQWAIFFDRVEFTSQKSLNSDHWFKETCSVESCCYDYNCNNGLGVICA